MTIALVVCAVLTVGLSAYSLGHYLCALVFLLGTRKPRHFAEHGDASVAVLVPARNEGDRALRVITSLVDQDHAGLVEVYLLLKDRSDTAIAELKLRYPEADLETTAETVELVRTENRRVVVAFTGSDPKSDKLNWVAKRLDTRYVAILDCDHQAYPDWIRSSVALLVEQRARMVQCRRDPISARGFFSLWDSLHQHIGCELFNTAFTRLGMTVFFTGTTAVMDTALLRDNPMSSCITEDIDFSYRVMLQGVRIIDNPYSGSAEETSPDLYSFLARRRRWSNGHTSTFFRQLWASRSVKLPLRQRVQLSYHGSHYLVSVGVFVLHLLIGLVFIRTFSPTSQVAATVSSLLLAYLMARTQRTVGFFSRSIEVIVLFAWVFPAVVIAMNLIQGILLNDFSRAAIPIAHSVQAIGLVGLLAPLTVLLIGMFGFRQLGLGSFLAVVLTYPVAFYIDLSGVLLGLADWVSGGARWRAVSRREAPVVVSGLSTKDPLTPASGELLPTLSIKDSWRLASLLPAAPAASVRYLRMLAKPSRWIPASVMVLFFCAGAMFTPSTLLEVAPRSCKALEHDTDPWIVPAKRIEGYCPADPKTDKGVGKRTGTFHAVDEPNLISLAPTYWDRLDKTFFCNLSHFRPDNVEPGSDGFSIRLERRAMPEREFASGGVVTKDEPESRFKYGRFETVMKAAKESGVITAFFLYRFDPWQEIDAEIVGNDTTKILLNVYFNPGEEGDLFNYGLRGTPVLVDLGFDASLDFHKYAIEWEANEIRWFVDDQLIHVRREGFPTPIPNLPMRFFVNMWPICSEELAGPFNPGDEPILSQFKTVTLSRWYPAPFAKLSARFDALFEDGDAKDWRQKAKWIKPSPQ